MHNLLIMEKFIRDYPYTKFSQNCFISFKFGSIQLIFYCVSALWLHRSVVQTNNKRGLHLIGVIPNAYIS